MHQYDWAVNKLKLFQAVSTLEAKKKLDSRVVVSEQTIKEEYVIRGGLLAQYKPKIEAGKVVRVPVPPIKEQLAEMKAEEKKEVDEEATPSEPEAPKKKSSKKE